MEFKQEMFVLRVNGVATAQMTTNEVMQLVRQSDGKLLLELERFVLVFFFSLIWV